MEEYKKYRAVDGAIIILGFGCLGQALLPLLFRHFFLESTQVLIISKTGHGKEIAAQFNIPFHELSITKDNYLDLLGNKLHPGDFLVNLSTNISSLDLILLCQERKSLYLDASIEPWEGTYTDETLNPSLRSNYALREEVIRYKQKGKSTAVITHGANPGLISHLLKKALLNMAYDNDLDINSPHSSLGWNELAYRLGIKSIHIAESDTQVTNISRKTGKFMNTWSVAGLLSEASQPAELGWGTHERHWPEDAHQHEFGSQCAIYLDRMGLNTKVRSWTPGLEAYHGFLITHGESISIANYLTIRAEGKIIYRPTVHYAYHPCPDALLSLHDYFGSEGKAQMNAHILLNDIKEGIDELGILLMGNKKGAYWYGSRLSIQEARQLVSYNNATSLQVVSSVLAAIIWALEHPDEGIVEPEDLDYEYILDIALPYLGQVQGHYTSWDPLKVRNKLFPERIDKTDPWQFINIRVP